MSSSPSRATTPTSRASTRCRPSRSRSTNCWSRYATRSAWTAPSPASPSRTSTACSTPRGSAARRGSPSRAGTRCSAHTERNRMPKPLDNAVVLITGGTGSLGQTLVRRLLRGELGTPRRIIVFSRDEAKQYAMKTSWKHAHRATDDIYYHNFEELIQFRIGDVRDPVTTGHAVDEADVVFHAAAMKQVPTCEYFPAEAAATNITGAINIVRAARRSKSTRMVLAVSTDKACKPINVMGMTKAVQERVVVEGNLEQDHCRMIGVRYGNVLSSRGSVIPLFRQQIEHGGPVTITLPEMTRFLLSLDSAVDTIFAAVEHAERGEIFVPRVPSARITDVAD